MSLGPGTLCGKGKQAPKRAVLYRPLQVRHTTHSLPPPSLSLLPLSISLTHIHTVFKRATHWEIIQLEGDAPRREREQWWSVVRAEGGISARAQRETVAAIRVMMVVIWLHLSTLIGRQTQKQTVCKLGLKKKEQRKGHNYLPCVGNLLKDKLLEGQTHLLV